MWYLRIREAVNKIIIGIFNPYTAALEIFRAWKAMSSLLRSKYFKLKFRARMNYVRVAYVIQTSRARRAIS
jgi:hypothetical protein